MVKRVALSWSGGKDCCLALDTLIKQGVEVACLVTTIPIELGRTFGHGEKADLMKMQSEALNIPIEFIHCSFENYTDNFQTALHQYKSSYQLDGIAFGDLYLEGHREWGENVANAVGLKAIYPLWGTKEDVFHLLEAFLSSGYEATIIRIRKDVLEEAWLGRKLDTSFLEDVKKTEICPMGESGEYHTFVSDGPLFKKKIMLHQPQVLELESSKKVEFNHFELLSKEGRNA